VLKLFITATDTNVGKTFFSTLLLRAWREQEPNRKILGLKPLVSGDDRDLRLLLAEQPGKTVEEINLHSFPMPAAPSVAANAGGGPPVDPEHLVSWCRKKMEAADCGLLEGAGGWMVPIAGKWCVADWAAALAWPVVLVVPNRLGCINHSLLTAADIVRRKLNFAGVILNYLNPNDDDPTVSTNRQILEEEFGLPFLGEVPFEAERLKDSVLQNLQAPRC